MRRESADFKAVAEEALAPLGLGFAPAPLGSAGAPEAQPGAAVAGQPSITRPTAESAEAPLSDLLGSAQVTTPSHPVGGPLNITALCHLKHIPAPSRCSSMDCSANLSICSPGAVRHA